jgi:amino acid adenylation domain-containing protein
MDGLASTAVRPAPDAGPPANAGPLADHEPFPLTDLQEGYLVGTSRLIELGGFRPTYYVELDVAGFDPVRAEAAMRRLVLRHEHLRTVILADGGQRVLDADEATGAHLSVVDLVDLDHERAEAVIRQTRERLCEQGLDPVGWPLFEVVANRVRPHRARVHLAMSLLLLDGKSIRQVVSEWQQLYQDPGAELPPAPVTYRECRLSLLAHESTETYRTHWRYWADRLDSLPDAPQLPLARPLASVDPVRFSRRTSHLTREQWQRLRAAFRRHRILPTAALLHVFAEVLGAWASSPQFCLNVLHQTWVSNHPEWASTVGQLGATLPLEVDLRRGHDFWQRAEQTQRQLWRDLAHSDVTAVRVMREVAARRGWTPRAALPYVFTSMLGPTGQDSPEPAAAPGRPACRTVTSALRTPQVLIDNQIQDAADGGIVCVWDIVDDAFPPGLPDAMVEAYQGMLDALASPATALAAPAPDPVPANHRALVAAVNTTAGPLPAERLEDGFLRRAAAEPDAIAVVTSQRTMTYGELEAASRAVAHWLRAEGVGLGDIVPVVMPKGGEQVVAVLGALRAGAAYCPIDAATPLDRIQYLLGECGARVVLGQSRTPARAAHPAAVLHVDQARPAAEDLPPADGGSIGLAYVIYTSGSTGQPKGVMIDHRGALNTILDVNQRVGLTAADRVFGISSLSFDLSVWDIFGTLAAGAALVLPDATPRPDPIGWADTAAAHGVTVWNSVPALAEMLVEVGEARPAAGRPPIRAFLLSGDWIPTALPDRMRSGWPGVRIIAMGGATEASIWSNSYEVGRVDPAWRSIPYGKPLRNQTMRVLDHRLGVRPPWAVGHIYIGGVGVAQGYWRDEKRTAERFVRDPATRERLYWTGDLGRYWPDGTIEFLGREDRQLKIQGFRVEPGEVESAIRAHPAVREAVVCAEDVPGGQRRLVSLVVPRDGELAGDQAIIDHLRLRLPHYMIPGRVHVVERLPLTANGKVDVARALAGLAAARPGPAAQPARQPASASPDPVVRKLGALWAELLQAPAVGADENFFALGGNSLLALRLVNRVRAELAVELPVGQIFAAPTPQELASRIERNGRGAEPGGGGGGSGSMVTLAQRPGDELFLFHPVGGSVASYVGLAREWPGPVHAFASRALGRGAPSGLDPGDAELTAMAAGYRAELQRHAPSGPYLLGGWSMGGVLAYEVARQLAGLGHRAAVFMIDSDIRNVRRPDTETARHVEFLSDLAGGRLPATAGRAVREADPATLGERVREIAVEHGLLPAEVDPPGYQRLMRTHAHNLAALAAYQPEPADLPVLLLVAGLVDRPDPVPAWQAVCSELEAEVWPHDHYSIVAGDQLAAVTARVTAWLAGVRARWPAPDGSPTATERRPKSSE